MSRVWVVMPSVRPVEEAQPCIDAWRYLGYNVAVIRQGRALINCTYQLSADCYLGFPMSINRLIKEVLALDPQVDWFVVGNDDCWPDQTLAAKDIAAQCVEHFGSTLGVMQPTGDRYDRGYIDFAAASAWVGSYFAQRINGGNGVLREEYFHYYCDTELWHVATNMGLYQKRQDLTQEHKHWSRTTLLQPSFLDKPIANLYHDKLMYYARLAIGFPGSSLL